MTFWKDGLICEQIWNWLRQCFCWTWNKKSCISPTIAGVEITAGHRSCLDKFLLLPVTFTDLIYLSGHFLTTDGNVISWIYFSIMIFSVKWKHFSLFWLVCFVFENHERSNTPLCWLVYFVVENHEQSTTLVHWFGTMKKWSVINMCCIQNKNKYVWSVLHWVETGARQTDRHFPDVFFLFPNNSKFI